MEKKKLNSLTIRQLEKNLLTCLNEAKGRILDDDNVINTLEILKSEAAEVGRKVDETDQVRGKKGLTESLKTKH